MRKIIYRLELFWLLVTRRADEMCPMGKGQEHVFIPTRSRRVFGFSGTDCTVNATFALLEVARDALRRRGAVGEPGCGVDRQQGGNPANRGLQSPNRFAPIGACLDRQLRKKAILKNHDLESCGK